MKMTFVIWAVVGLIFIGIGIFDYFSEKAAGFWGKCENGADRRGEEI